jgi:hypothetical protein
MTQRSIEGTSCSTKFCCRAHVGCSTSPPLSPLGAAGR